MIRRNPSKPVEGHRLRHVTYGVRTNCECGWTSSMWLGQGARSSAYAEFDMHKEKCRKEQAQPKKEAAP